MAKKDEIEHIETVSRVDNIDPAVFKKYLKDKPFSDPEMARYLTDMAQILNLLPKPPANILDMGVGSGWTSYFFAKKGYDVLGIDISPDMIAIAKEGLTSSLSLTFEVCDYEKIKYANTYDCVVFYDSLHHCDDQELVLRKAFEALKPNGMLLCIEPGKGHSESAQSKKVVEKYGTTEKDMPFCVVHNLLRESGFTKIHQYPRLSMLAIEDIHSPIGPYRMIQNFTGLIYETKENGLTSVIQAIK